MSTDSPAATPTAPAAPVAEAAPAPIPTIQYEDFAKVALRAGKVLSCAPHPNADKLLVLTVDLGEAEARTIVAGLALRYAPEALVGRTVLVVANLKPAKLRGIVSQGMLLAAGEGAVEGLATLDEAVAPGTVIR